MSRSRHHGCGRGCGACGDAGASRRAREHAWQRADARDGQPDAAAKTVDVKDMDGFSPWKEHR